jgi:hypothetical protein
MDRDKFGAFVIIFGLLAGILMSCGSQPYCHLGSTLDECEGYVSERHD